MVLGRYLILGYLDPEGEVLKLTTPGSIAPDKGTGCSVKAADV